MSVVDLLPTVSALPRAGKIQLMQFIVGELAREEGVETTEIEFVPPPEDGCPYTPAELARMRKETGGVPLSEIWRRLGVS